MTPVTLGTISNTWLSNATWTANTTEEKSRNVTSDTLHIKITSWLDTNANNAITTQSNFRNMTSATLKTNSNTWLGNASWVANSTESYFGNITSPENSFAVSVTMYILFVISVCLVILGLLGNMTTILIMQQRPFKSKTHSILLSALAIIDTMCLSMFLFFKPCVAYLFGFDMRSLGDVVCRLLQYLFYIARVSGSAMIILICFERFIAVCFPLKAKFILAKNQQIFQFVFALCLLSLLVGWWCDFLGRKIIIVNQYQQTHLLQPYLYLQYLHQLSSCLLWSFSVLCHLQLASSVVKEQNFPLR